MEITLNDIASVVTIIDVVTTRGGFRGEELSEVGDLRNRFVAFLQAAQAQETESQENHDSNVVDVEPIEALLQD